jgi:hypothetical protein
MLFLLTAIGFAAYETVPLTNEYVVLAHDYAIASVRTLFPDAPATGTHPQVTSAQLQAASGYDIRLHIVVVTGVELDLTIYRDVKGTLQITEIAGHQVQGTTREEYRWEAVTALTERTKEELKTHLAAAPYNFAGDLVTVLGYRSQQGGAGGPGQQGQQTHHVIYLDETRKVYSVVFHSEGGIGQPGQQLTISSFKSVEAGTS